MPRVRKQVASRARRKKYLKIANGFRSGRRRLYRSARETVERALVYAYRDRKVRKREFRALWITRINAALRRSGDVLQQIHGRPEEGRNRHRPQGPGRYGHLCAQRLFPPHRPHPPGQLRGVIDCCGEGAEGQRPLTPSRTPPPPIP